MSSRQLSTVETSVPEISAAEMLNELERFRSILGSIVLSGTNTSRYKPTIDCLRSSVRQIEVALLPSNANGGPVTHHNSRLNQAVLKSSKRHLAELERLIAQMRDLIDNP